MSRSSAVIASCCWQKVVLAVLRWMWVNFGLHFLSHEPRVLLHGRLSALLVGHLLTSSAAVIWLEKMRAETALKVIIYYFIFLKDWIPDWPLYLCLVISASVCTPRFRSKHLSRLLKVMRSTLTLMNIEFQMEWLIVHKGKIVLTGARYSFECDCQLVFPLLTDGVCVSVCPTHKHKTIRNVRRHYLL